MKTQRKRNLLKRRKDLENQKNLRKQLKVGESPKIHLKYGNKPNKNNKLNKDGENLKTIKKMINSKITTTKTILIQESILHMLLNQDIAITSVKVYEISLKLKNLEESKIVVSLKQGI